MAAYNVRQPGYPTLGELAIDLINNLVMGSASSSGSGTTTTTSTTSAPGSGISAAKGFRLVFPNTLPNKTDNLDVATGYFKSTTYHTAASTGGTIPVARYILESTTEVDAITTTTQTNPATFSFANTTLTDGWRICIEFPLVDDVASPTPAPTITTGAPGVQPTVINVGPPNVFKEFMAVYVGTSVQLRNDGTVVALPSIPSTPGGTITFLEPAGMLGAAYRPSGGELTSAAALKPPVTAGSGSSGGFPGIAGAPATPGAAPAAPTAGSWDVGFYNRIGITRDSGYAVQLTYELTMT